LFFCKIETVKIGLDMKIGLEEMKISVWKLSENGKEKLLKLLEETRNPKSGEKKMEFGKYEGKIFLFPRISMNRLQI